MSDDVRNRIIEALNDGDKFQSCSLDRDGAIFDALCGEYGAVILSARQVDALARLIGPVDAINTV